MSENTANIVALIGATGQGKSATFKGWLKEAPPARLMLWDVMDEYGELQGVKRCGTLEQVVTESQASAFALRYVPRGDPDQQWKKFDAFCRIAFARGSLTLGCEELNTVTRPNGGPGAWSDCTLRGRHKSLCIVGLSQRPALVDKNFFSNATRIRCFRLNFDDDVSTMAAVLGVDRDRIRTLKPLQYLERDMQSGAVEGGALFAADAPGDRAVERPAPSAKAAETDRQGREPAAAPSREHMKKKARKKRRK